MRHPAPAAQVPLEKITQLQDILLAAERFLSYTGETITITPIAKRALRGHLGARLIISWIYIYKIIHPQLGGWRRRKNQKKRVPTHNCPSVVVCAGSRVAALSGESWPGGRYRSECRSSSLSVRIAAESASFA